MKKIVILGCGVVGSGVLAQLKAREKELGKKFKIVCILDRHPERINKQYRHLVCDELPPNLDADIAIECLGGVEIAYWLTRNFLQRGIDVVTSNKAVVAEKGAKLIEIAKASGAKYMMEASVGGEIPIISKLTHHIQKGDKPLSISAILNGTTNYILSKMSNGLSFASALADAQIKGFAEKDPTDDVEGYDVARKLAILASIVTQKEINYKEISTFGITKITQEKIKSANIKGKAIKLIASAKFNSKSLCVKPKEVPLSSEIGKTNGVTNIVQIDFESGFSCCLSGRGAGSEATANSIWADISALIKNDAIMPYWTKKTQYIAKPNLASKQVIAI